MNFKYLNQMQNYNKTIKKQNFCKKNTGDFSTPLRFGRNDKGKIWLLVEMTRGIVIL